MYQHQTPASSGSAHLPRKLEQFLRYHENPSESDAACWMLLSLATVHTCTEALEHKRRSTKKISLDLSQVVILVHTKSKWNSKKGEENNMGHVLPMFSQGPRDPLSTFKPRHSQRPRCSARRPVRAQVSEALAGLSYHLTIWQGRDGNAASLP